MRGARQHNLKDIDVEIRHGDLTVVTGPSGSGKSSLAFDTLYAEGQRRYVESLSTYAKQFLERMPKPDVDRIDGIRPSVAIDQRNTVRTSRSTVGTVTEVWDYLRLLWSRVGHTICPECGIRVVPDTVTSATEAVMALSPGTRVYVTFPWTGREGLDPSSAGDQLRSRGYVRVVVDGKEHHLDPESQADPDLPLTAADEVLVVVDRVAVSAEDRERVAEALADAFAESHGHAEVLIVDRDAEGELRVDRQLPFNERFRCSRCDREFPEPTPLLFSFNHPVGACETCNGFGAVLEYDYELIVPDPDRSLAEGAIDPWTKPRYRKERAALLDLASRRGADVDASWRELPETLREELLHGSDEFVGVFPFLRGRERKRYKQYIRVFLRQYQRPRTCPSCDGARLTPEALNVRIGTETIASIAELTFDRLADWLDRESFTPFEAEIADTVLDEIRDRVSFLRAVGLGYLAASRQARSLSGGEMQRIRLAGSLGSRLVDTLYVLDEPTIGLHPRDADRFLTVLRRLRDTGNTVLVVEHDEAVLRVADRIIELGPGAGEHGGTVVFEGDWETLLAAGTATGKALQGDGRPRRERSDPGSGGWLVLRGATLHNVRDLELRVPLGALTVVTGVSGSGKSTLIHDLLYRALEADLLGASSARLHLGEASGQWESLTGTHGLGDVILVDQSPIGRTPRSNPITYIKGWGEIRKLFADQPESRRRGYGPGHFSFNVSGGRCDACKGAGEEVVEMVFLADVSVPCEVCGGARFKPEILEIRFRGKNIREVLDLTVDEAIRFFIRQDRLGETLWQLQRVGLGYLRLGQSATTLSGGEAQRLKIARELARGAGGKKRIYLLDEPTVGLGAGEVGRLTGVLRQLTGAGHTVVVVEHNLDVIASADWIVDLGPEAGIQGGRIVAEGPPRSITARPESHTGRFLERHLERRSRLRPEVSGAGGA
ncbi:MAG: excinuclease ABC subunit UvrA [Gemmatimonadota bacterium]